MVDAQTLAATNISHERATHLGRRRLLFAALACALCAACLMAIGIGAVEIHPLQAIAILAAQLNINLPFAFDEQQAAVLLMIRLPRVVFGAMVGAGLAIAGASLQGLFRNPLADPALIGVSGGAALAAVLLIVFGDLLLANLGEAWRVFALPLAAFAGGLAAVIVVQRLAQDAGRATAVATMLLAGIAINALTGAATGLMTFVATDAQLRSITFWSLGSLGGATWTTVMTIALFVIVPSFALWRASSQLNALLLGEAEAAHLGISVEKLKRRIIICAAMIVGACVATSGIIGFVGLIVPHLLRLMAGADNRVIAPASMLAGAVLLVTADTIARNIVAPAELPIGILTALIGAPFFLWLLVRGKREGKVF